MMTTGNKDMIDTALDMAVDYVMAGRPPRIASYIEGWFERQRAFEKEVAEDDGKWIEKAAENMAKNMAEALRRGRPSNKTV